MSYELVQWGRSTGTVRPTSVPEGWLHYDETSNRYEFYTGSSWVLWPAALGELRDVALSSETELDLLVYSSSGSEWVNTRLGARQLLYGNASSGQNASLTVAAGEVVGVAPGGTELDGLDGEHVERVLCDDAGTSFPEGPDEGQRFYRTDLEEWFYYDSSRSKWLGFAIYSVMFFTDGIPAATTYLYLAGQGAGTAVTGSATFGEVAQFDLVCVGMSYITAASSTCTITVRDDGSSVTGGGLAISAATSVHSNSLNSSTIAEGSIIAVAVTSGSAIGCYGHAYFRRVAT